MISRANKWFKGPESRKFVQLKMIVVDETSFFLSLQAGKPGWFCGNMGARVRDFQRAYLNFMTVKAVMPESTDFKVEVCLGLIVYHTPKREDCVFPHFTHNPLVDV